MPLYRPFDEAGFTLQDSCLETERLFLICSDVVYDYCLEIGR